MFKVLNQNRIFIFLTTIGILSSIYMLIPDLKTAPVSKAGLPRPVSPYKNFIVGVGMVEAASGNISLGTPVGGIVDKILVKKGDVVSKGTPIFTLLARQIKADLNLRLAQVEAAKVEVEKEEVTLAYAQQELDLVTQLADRRGIKKEEFISRQSSVLISQATLKYAQVSLKVAQAQAIEAQEILNLYTIRAPIDCEIMQINIHPGEYATPEYLPTPLLLVGDTSRYHIRVNVSELDAWRFNENEPATAYLPGNSNYQTELKFEYIEPYVIAQGNLPDIPSEQAGLRALQVVYSYDPKALPSYLGQGLEVYIRAEKIAPRANNNVPPREQQ